ncbi:MAG: hypothetical protein AB7W59_14340 [Acidimicrobiia bacterium]
MIATILVGCSLLGCTAGGEQAAPTIAPPITAPATTDPPGCDVVPVEVAEPLPPGVDPGATPTLPPGVDTGYRGSGGGSGNPYLVPGARGVPGPAMTVTTLGAEPISIVVVAPPNPDVGSPAALAPGETTVPAPPTTLPPVITTAVPTGTSSSQTPGSATTGLMTLADDPGCVASRGEP